MQPIYILVAIPFFLLCILLEYLLGRYRNQQLYRLNDTLNNLLIGIGQQVCNLFYKALLLGLFVVLYDNFRVAEIPSTWWSVLLCVVVYDFIFYWAHRWGHEVNLFWGAHVVHHQSEEYNLSVALRQSWFHHLLAFFLFLPIPLLGFSPFVFTAAAAIQTVGQFWIHTKAIGKLHPIIEYIFNTPSHHRVHHSRDPKYLDKNHGGLLIIWDRLFGTFKEEEAADDITYGITTPLRSWNPLWANVHYYVELFQKAKHFTNWKDKFTIIFSAPGWLPDEAGGFQPPADVDKTTYQKYNQDTSNLLKWYAAIQFGVLLCGVVAFMYHFPTISLFYKVIFAGLIFSSMLIVGGIFENKKWVWPVEYMRLATVLLSLNTYYWYWHINWFAVTLVISLVIGMGFAVWLTVNYSFRPKWLFEKS
jgi:sterol desaturase/sphingolipid hydroxylase (fatty acid hydroxylase superfamily)